MISIKQFPHTLRNLTAAGIVYAHKCYFGLAYLPDQADNVVLFVHTIIYAL